MEAKEFRTVPNYCSLYVYGEEDMNQIYVLEIDKDIAQGGIYLNVNLSPQTVAVSATAGSGSIERFHDELSFECREGGIVFLEVKVKGFSAWKRVEINLSKINASLFTTRDFSLAIIAFIGITFQKS